MQFTYNDGGRQVAGYKGHTNDCVVRAIAIAVDMPYQTAYDLINAAGAQERSSKRRRGKSSARTGVYKPTIRKLMRSLGWIWTPTMHIGSGCKVHLRDGEIPNGRIIVSVSKHLSAVINGVINDTHDPSRNGTRCVYGYYWMKIE